MKNNKGVNINVGNVPCVYYYREEDLFGLNLTFNVGFFLHLLLICMCQLKFCEKQDEVRYNAGYLFFFGDY